MEKLFIHDLTPSQISSVLPNTDGYTVIDANRHAAFCRGGFRCWLASPGQCFIKDCLQMISAQIGNCREVTILSRCCYGGFSPSIKKVLDRCIVLSLPFFTYRGGKVHHLLLYPNRPKLTVCFYGAVTDFERDTARQLAEANRINMGFSSAQAFFAESPESLAEVTKSR